MIRSRRVLIIDSSRESREILRTLLRREGAETIEAAHVEQGAEMASRDRPDLIVFDCDDNSLSPQGPTTDLGRAASRSSIPIVVLGTARRHLSPFLTKQFVTKPYHYRPLIRRIGQILGTKSKRLA